MKINCLILRFAGLYLALTLIAGAYTPPSDPMDVTKVSKEMRAYFSQFLHPRDSNLGQATALVDAILDEDKFHFVYEWNGVYDCQEVFRTHKGNCISFSLFVYAILTEFGLEPKINEVLLYRTRWTSLGSYVAEVGHLNVSIKEADRTYLVDFFRILGYEHSVNSTYPISERYAISLFYSNYGVHSYAARHPDAIKWLEKSVEVDGNYLTHSNLATAYIYEKQYELAKKHLEKAKKYRKDERLYALVSTVERCLGNTKEEQIARKKAQRYIESNPFYHYNLARNAAAKGDFISAEKFLDKALRLKEELMFLELQLSIYKNLQKSTTSLEKRIARMTKRLGNQ